MAQRIGSEEESKRRVGTMFPKERLTRLKASRTVLSMTPKDLLDMEKAFGFRPEKVDNKKVQTLTTEDLLTLDPLFGDHRIPVGKCNQSAERGKQCCSARSRGVYIFKNKTDVTGIFSFVRRISPC